MSNTLMQSVRTLASTVLTSFVALALMNTVGAQTVQLPLDIMPGACPNPMKAGSTGVLPVSILGSANTAVANIDVGSVRLCTAACPLGSVSPSLLSYSYQDTSTSFAGGNCGCNTLGGDGFTDLRLKFDRLAVSNALGLGALPNNTVVTVIVTGLFHNGVPFTATDCLKVVKHNANNDCDGDGTNDNHEADCNNNGTPDDCEIFADCSHDGIPDTCQLPGNDCNQNGVPDACDPDCNLDGIPDACQILADCDNDGIPNSCEIDIDANGIPDDCEPPKVTPSLSGPGSLLLFPEVNSNQGFATLVTVTNTNSNATSGLVRIEWVYITEGTCFEFNRTDVLTPRDTLTVITNVHNQAQGRGFLYVFAKSPTTGLPISFNYLVGDSILLDGLNAFDYALAPLSFQAITAPGTLTDLDNDGVRDLDGLEYTRGPDRVIIPRFLGQDVQDLEDSHLILLGLSGGRDFTTIVNLLINNDNEDLFSQSYQFHCWTKPRLTDVSQIFRQDFLASTNHDLDEIIGAPQRESGWFEVNGSIATSSTTTIAEPCVLAVLVENLGSTNVANLPFSVGLQDNGDLFPHGAAGDN